MTALVQETSWTAGSSGNFAAPVTVGNSILLFICDYNVGGSAISSSSPLYNGAAVTGATKLFEVQNTGTRMYSAIWLLPNVQTSGTSVSYTNTNGANDVNSGKYIAEFSGLGATPTIDTGAPDPKTNSSATGGVISSGATGALVATSALVVGCSMNNNSSTGPGAPWTVFADPANGGTSTAGYQIVSSAGGTFTYSATGTAGEWSAGVVAIVPSAGNVNVNGAVANVSVAAFPGVASVFSVATTAIANVVQGVPVRRWLTATGGTAPYTWAVTAGSLPTGLTLASDGTLSGTPTLTGTSSFTVRATDSTARTATANLSITSVSAPLSPSGPTTDANGVITWNVTSAINGNIAQTIRVLNPTSPSGYPHGFLFTLPVETGTDSTTYGNGLDTVRTLGLHNTYNLTVIEASFQRFPWYADNPTDGTCLEETYMLQVVSWAAAQYGTGGEKNYLIGFSKSGIGGQGLFFHWPGTFYGVASWDFPATMTGYDGTDPNHGTVGDSPSGVYGTQDNFAANYALSATNLAKWAAGQNFGTVNRVWIGDFFSFLTDVSPYDPTLTTAGILHTYAHVSQSAHAWNPTPGWVGTALAAIIPASGSVAGSVASVSIAAPAGTPSVTTAGPPAAVSVAAPSGTAAARNPATVAGLTASVLVRAPLGNANGFVPGEVQVSSSVVSSFGARIIVTAQATMEFEAGQPVQTSLTTLASDPWISMYPG